MRLTNVRRRYRPRHDRPTLLLTNQLQASASELIERYARRMLNENTITDTVDMDALSPAVPLRTDLGACS